MQGGVLALKEGQMRRGGGKLSRSETVSVRLDPRLKYLADIAARKHRRSLSSFVEWAIEDALGRVMLDEKTSINDAARRIWDLEEPNRLAKLAFEFPDMMTQEEQAIWKVVRNCDYFWEATVGEEGFWTWYMERERFRFWALYNHWEVVQEVAFGLKDPSALPRRPDPKPAEIEF